MDAFGMDEDMVTRLCYRSGVLLVLIAVQRIWKLSGEGNMRRSIELALMASAVAATGAVALGQTSATPPTASTAPVASVENSPVAPKIPSESVPPQSLPKTLEIPAGTKVLLTIRSAINTKTAQAGDGVYLQSSFPVIANGRAVIPAGVYVQGVVDSVERHIRIKGPAKLTMHFTSMIFPNGTVVEIPGQVNSLPGSNGPKVKGDEGTVQQGSGVGDVAKAAGQGAAIGAGIGGISGGVDGHPIEGLGIGGAGGAVVGAAVSLFTHGNDISIPSGTPIEMVLRQPLTLQEANLGGQDVTGEYVPAATQRQRMQKPNASPITCPPGSLGCN
jgi:type IV secretion system protein VirB10